MNKFLFFILMFPTLSYSVEYATGEKIFNKVDSSSKSNNYLYFDHPDDFYKFDTLTYIISNDESDVSLLESIYQYAKLIGKNNGATYIPYKINDRYVSLLKKANCLGKVDPNNIPSIVFYSSNRNKCYVLPYSNINVFNSILIDLYKILDKSENASQLEEMFYKNLLDKTLEEEAKKHEIPSSIVNGMKDFIDYVFKETRG